MIIVPALTFLQINSTKPNNPINLKLHDLKEEEEEKNGKMDLNLNLLKYYIIHLLRLLAKKVIFALKEKKCMKKIILIP